jgi:hypothetical protein
MGRYIVKCDDCKQTIRETDNIHESYEGGRCENCKAGVCPDCGDSLGSRYHEAAHSADVDTASTEELEAAASSYHAVTD